MTRVISSVFLILIAVFCTMAQTTAGRLSGTVSGPDGALPGAIVTLKSSQTGKDYSITTDSSGQFRFLQVEPASYSVKVTADGFKAYVATNLKVDVAREYTLNPTLEIGGIQETVEVSAGADVITSTTSQVTNTVSPQQILSLPLITRNPLSLTTLQPGVASNAFQNTSINGLRTT